MAGNGDEARISYSESFALSRSTLTLPQWNANLSEMLSGVVYGLILVQTASYFEHFGSKDKPIVVILIAGSTILVT